PSARRPAVRPDLHGIRRSVARNDDRATCSQVGQKPWACRAEASGVLYACEGGRDGRVVDGGGLENHCTRKGTGGSNPSPSANVSMRRSNRYRSSSAPLSKWSRAVTCLLGGTTTRSRTTPFQVRRKARMQSSKLLPTL